MNKAFVFCFLMFFSFNVLIAVPTDDQIQQAANTLEVPYDDLRQFVQSYQNSISTDIITVAAATYYEAYRSNAVKADSQYKEKTLKITGLVYRIYPDSIQLRTDNGYQMYPDTITVYFRPIELSKMANLESMQIVTFIGIGDGQTQIIDAVLVVN